MDVRKHFGDLPHERISIGEVRSSDSPLVLKTLLGSCVAVCLYDPECGKGGLNHISLPGSSPDKDARYGVHAMELLINELMGMGCNRKRLVAKAFGGGNVLSCIRTPVGTRNVEFVSTFLADENIPILAQRLGGDSALEVFFRTDTGYVLLRTLSGKQQQRMASAESARSTSRATSIALSASQDAVLF